MWNKNCIWNLGSSTSSSSILSLLLSYTVLFGIPKNADRRYAVPVFVSETLRFEWTLWTQ